MNTFRTFLIISLWILLRIRIISNEICGENQNTHFGCNNIFFPKLVFLSDNVEKYCTVTIGHRWWHNTAHNVEKYCTVTIGHRWWHNTAHNAEKYCTVTIGHRWHNTAHTLCMSDNQGYKHTRRICNAYCFSTATVVTRTRLNVTFYVHCPSF
jgi:hypothetical protein